MNRYVTTGCLVAGIVLAIGACRPEKPAPLPEMQAAPAPMSLGEKLNTIIIPDYPTEGLTLEDAVEILRVKSRNFSGKAGGEPSREINIVIIAGGDRKLPSSSGLGFRDVPLAEALRHITGLVDLKYTVEPHAVTIREVQDMRKPSDPKPGGLQERLGKIIRPNVSFQNATLEESLEYLRVSSGCLDLAEGDRSFPALNYVLHPSASTKRHPISLDLRDIPLDEALRYCAEISHAELRYDPFAVVVTDKETGRPGGDLPAAAPRLVLPAIDLTGATLADSLEFIRVKSRELSPDHSAASMVVSPGSADTPITLGLKAIPLGEALRYIAELSGNTLTFDGRSFVFSRGEKR